MSAAPEADALDRLIRPLEKAAMAVAGCCVVGIMVVVSIDALSRYAFKAPLPITFELVTYYLLLAAVYLALSGTFQQGDHIHIDLVQRRLPRRVRAAVDALGSLLAIAVFALIVSGSWAHMVEAYRGKEFIPGVIVWPVWLSYLPIVVGCALLVLRLLHHVSALLRHGHDPAVQVHDGEGASE